MKTKLLWLLLIGALATAANAQTDVQRFSNPIKPYASAGASQYGLAVSTNTTLTVPAGAACAQITVEGNQVRRTSDGTSATTSVGILLGQGASWWDCGPLAAYKFTAVAGTPSLNVEYFK